MVIMVLKTVQLQRLDDIVVVCYFVLPWIFPHSVGAFQGSALSIRVVIGFIASLWSKILVWSARCAF